MNTDTKAACWWRNCLGSGSVRIFAAALLVLFGIFGLAASAQNSRVAVVLTLDGVVGPATADYIVRGIQRAAERKATLVVLRMDTPGGLDTSMRDIIREILASPVPVASFVTPSGARAASAGTYILYASHVAAMVPGTNLGAATPIAIGGSGGLPFGSEQDKDGGKAGKDKPAAPANASEAKAINDAVAYIRGLAEIRDRNADWAEQAVREASSLTATDAARENVIDFTATSIDDLLAKANGMSVRVGHAETVLDTQGLAIEEVAPDWRTRFLSVITHPNVALIFMMIGIYGLIFEFMNPGALVPGTIGGISLVMGLYALAVLPVTYAGVGLVFLGAALLVAEAITPSFGVLGVGGTAAFVLGAAILFDTDVPGFQISWQMLGAVGIASLLMSLLVAWLAFTSRRGKVVTGKEQMIGAAAEVLSWNGNAGYVLAHGERWKAVADMPLTVGQTVRIEDIDGLTLKTTAALIPATESPQR
ncbi:NfeD family protein [Mesorhizobium sp. A623]